MCDVECLAALSRLTLLRFLSFHSAAALIACDLLEMVLPRLPQLRDLAFAVRNSDVAELHRLSGAPTTASDNMKRTRQPCMCDAMLLVSEDWICVQGSHASPGCGCVS